MTGRGAYLTIPESSCFKGPEKGSVLPSINLFLTCNFYFLSLKYCIYLKLISMAHEKQLAERKSDPFPGLFASKVLCWGVSSIYSYEGNLNGNRRANQAQGGITDPPSQDPILFFNLLHCFMLNPPFVRSLLYWAGV